ncbi:MAG: hypothetical protein IPF77_01060 [Gemmatimonadetes bacterium]|nr:hypothetical protein [Gemmatimonadota bacterium]
MNGAEGSPTAGSRLSTLAVAALVLLLGLHLVLAWLIREPGITVRNDDALYLLLARSLAHGQFRDLHLAGAPPHALYPPGYPVFLLVLGALGGERIDLFLAANICLSVASLWLTFDLVRRRWSVPVAFLVLIPLAVNNTLVRYAGSLISEPPYLFLGTFALWLLSRGAVGPRLLAAGTVVIVAAGLTRSVGVVLLAAVVGWLFLERRPRAAILVGAIGGLCIGGWLLRTFLLPDEFRTIGRSYAEDLERMVHLGGDFYLTKRFRIGVFYATVFLPEALPIPGVREGTQAITLWGAALAALVPVGLVLWWRRGWTLGAAYVVGYVVLLAMWRMSSPRFLAVILPLLMAAIVVPLSGWRGPALRRAGLGLAGLLVLLLVVEAGRRWNADWQALAGCNRADPLGAPGCFPPDTRSFFRLARRVPEVVPADGVVLTAREATFAYYSGRTGAYLNRAFTPDSAHILPGLERQGVGYVLLGHTHSTEVRLLAPALARDCQRLDLLLAEPERSALFRIRSPAEGPGDLRACTALQVYRADSTPVARQRK